MLDVGGAGRAHRLFLPDTGRRGLVVMLHGCTQDPGDFARGTGMNEQAGALGLAVLYPDQPERENSRRCWNWFQPAHQERERGEPGLIVELVRRVGREHGLEGQPVFVAGLSAGGAMTAILASVYPDVFQAAGIHSGLPARAARTLPGAILAMRGVRLGKPPAARFEIPIILFQGGADKVVHPRNAAYLVQQIAPAEPPRVEAGAGYQVTRYGDRLEVWEITQLGHAWSGGSSQGSYTEPAGPRASSAILRFFENHRTST